MQKLLDENQFGVQDSLVYGIKSVKNELTQAHPLAATELNHALLEEKQTLSIIGTMQGRHAAFKLKHEFDYANKIGRLPCLRSSNLMKSVLNGTDELLDITDVLDNQRYFCEHNYDPHSELYKIGKC